MKEITFVNDRIAAVCREVRVVDILNVWCQLGTTMAATTESKLRVTARIPASLRRTLEQAAEMTGSTLNQFVVQSACVEAQRIIERETVIRLSQESAKKVLELVDRPPKPNRKLQAALKTHSKIMRR